MTERGKKLKETFMRKYGVEHPSQLPSVKEKIKKKRENGSYDNMIINMKKTLKERYGDENYNNLEKGKETKLQLYGDENYNNRDKMLETNMRQYGMNVSPNTIKSTSERSISGEIGFKSDKFKEFLKNNNVNNVSQLISVKNKKIEKQTKRFIQKIFFGDRLKGLVKPLFTENEYTNSEYTTLYKFKCCKCGEEFEDTLYSGNIPRCLMCFPHNKFKSQMELDIIDFLNSNNIKCKQHDRSILDGNEIDILTINNIGIEYDGIIWHSECFGKKDKLYHLRKTNYALSKNIKLLHIWDWEWLNKKELIKSMLLNKLGKSEKIYARKCNIILIDDNKTISEFLEKNHIQGKDKSSIKIGLTYNNELVSVMTFGKTRFDKKYEYEILRFCNKLNLSVIGGSSKLFSYFINNYKPTSIVSYCDKRYFNGKVYSNIGMKFENNTSPNYWYFNKNYCVPINRINFQKHKLKNILPIFDENLSEWENMKLNGYDRIWDCGNLKYVWTNPNNHL